MIAGAEAIPAAARIVERAASRGFLGHDPYDGLWWPAPKVMRSGRRRRQVLIQVHARLPVDVRGVYRRRPPLIPKTLGLFGRAALGLHLLQPGDERHRALCERALDLTEGCRSVGEPAWGYPFDVQTRWSYYPGGTPNVVVTSFVSRALEEAGAELGRDDYTEAAQAAGHWVLERLFDETRGYFVYHRHSDKLIHNASLLAARLVWRSARSAPGADDAVRRAVERTLEAQRPDGAWEYGEGPGLEFVDGLHSGYILECLAEMRGAADGIEDAIDLGTRYYIDECFRADGAAKLRPDSDFPEDGHSAGTALTALSALHGIDGAAHAADRVAARTLSALVHPDGVVFRRHRLGASRVHYVRWVEGHVAQGLARYALVRSGGAQPVAGR